jgi:hypothetical protein
MKSLLRIIPVMAATLVLFSMPALSDDGTMGQKSEVGQEAQKDECLLVAKNCSSDSIDARVDRLKTEISRGSAVYSDEELNQLRRELNDAYKFQKINNNVFPPVVL